MDGNVGAMVDALITHFQAEKLKEAVESESAPVASRKP